MHITPMREYFGKNKGTRCMNSEAHHGRGKGSLRAILALALALVVVPVMAQTANTKTVYTYDALDRVTQVTDPSGLSATYQYDGLSDPTSTTSPDTGLTARTFDAAGNVLTATDAKGITVTYTYDAQDRRLSASYADSTQNIVYHYDEPNSTTGCSTSYPIGRLTRIIENTVTTVYCYDPRGNVIQKQQITAAGTDATGYSISNGGRLSGIVYPSGSLVSYTRDGDGRIQSIGVTLPSGAASTAVSGVTYQPFGPVSGYTLGNGQTIARTYDANYRLTDLTSPAFNLHVARDAMGDITAIGNAPGANPATETYAYDPLYRLLSVTEASGSVLEGVTYNATGDRLTKTGSGLDTGTYTYTSGTHQLNAVGNNAFSTDADGNTTAMTQAGSTYGFGYSDRNRMTVAQIAGATVGSYVYNALGQRIQKVASSATERYDYNEGSQMLGEYGATNRDYIWLGGIPVANVDTSGTTSTIAYVTADQLGTPRGISSGSGTTEWQLPYQGNPWSEVEPTSNGYTYNLRSPGEYADAETGTNDNINRTRSPSLGRFAQSDPSGLNGGISTYAAVNNNPLTYIDPNGLDAVLLINPTSAYIPFTGGYGGHAAVLVGNDDSGWNYYSEDGISDGTQLVSIEEFPSLMAFENAMGNEYTVQTAVTTSSAQDEAMNMYAFSNIYARYNALTNNCGDFAKRVLQSGGINVRSNLILPTMPNEMSIDEWNPGVYLPNNPAAYSPAQNSVQTPTESWHNVLGW